MVTTARRNTTKKESPTPLVGTAAASLKQYLTVKGEIGWLTTRMNELKGKLSDLVEREGYADEKGNVFYDLPDEVEVEGKVYRGLKREHRVSVFFDEDKAEQRLVELDLYDQATSTSTYLDQDKVYALQQRGQLSEEDLDSFFGTTETYAFRPLQ